MTWFFSVWPFIAHAGLGMTLIAGCLAAAYFSPVFKKDFLYAALVVMVCLFMYGVGVRDEKHKRDAAEQALAGEVHKAVDGALRDKTKDPYDDPKN